MSLFKNLFGSEEQQSQSTVAWENLSNTSQLINIKQNSFNKPALIFKHSTRCGISRMVLKKFEKEYDLQHKVTPYFLDLLSHREVSSAVSEEFNVQHQSPQLLLIKDGNTIYHASHDDIEVAAVAKLL